MLRAGATFDKIHRLFLSYVNYGVEDDGDFRIFLANYNYLIPLSEEFRLFTGLHLGHANYEEDNLKMSGLVYGPQIGAIYNITKTIQVELGIEYTKYNLDHSINGTVNGIDYSEVIEIEDSTSF